VELLMPFKDLVDTLESLQNSLIKLDFFQSICYNYSIEKKKVFLFERRINVKS
jgi:hypothetical protein